MRNAAAIGSQPVGCPGRSHTATLSFLTSFAAVAVGLGAARAATTTYVPVLLQQIADRPALIGLAMLSNALAGFVVPLVAGAYADRGSSRAALILGGAAIASGGLVAVALGNASTYLVLTLAAAGVYVGLNVAQTAHRTLIPERFHDGARPRATSAQELAQLTGALAGTAIGGILVVSAPAALFVAVATIVLLTAVPTVRLAEVRRVAAPVARERRAKAGLAAALRRPGTRELLVAQGLWVMAYVGILPFFALYADSVLGLGPATAGVILAAFGLLTGAGMLLAARVAPGDVRAMLAGGAAMLGAGLALAATGSRISAVAAPFALAAIGAGIVTSLGFAYYSRFIPAGESGRYSGAFFAVRAVAATVAVPLAGLTVELSGSYRGVLALGPLALLAVAPILMAERRGALATRRPLRSVFGATSASPPDRVADPRTWLLRLASMVLLGLAGAAALPALQPLDERLFLLVNGLGDGPEWLYAAIDPHSRNYALLTVLVVVASIVARRHLRHVAGAAFAVVLAAFAADLVLEVIQLAVDRPRPEEVVGTQAQLSHQRSWAHIPSFPSGHLVVTAAMVAAAGTAVRSLRYPLLVYLAAVAVTRIAFGAHFPLDVAFGAVIGWEVGLVAAAMAAAAGLLPGGSASLGILPGVATARGSAAGDGRLS